MAENSCDHTGIDTGSQHCGCSIVPTIVESPSVQTGSLSGHRPRLPHIPWVRWVVGRGENEIGVEATDFVTFVEQVGDVAG